MKLHSRKNTINFQTISGGQHPTTPSCYNFSKVSEHPFSLQEGKIDRFCQRWDVNEFAIFGFSLRNLFNALSDIDILVSNNDSAEITLLDLSQRNLAYRWDMRTATQETIEFIQGVSQSEFVKNSQLRYAVERQLMY